MSELWLTFLAFAISVWLLYLVQRWITQHMQGIGMLLFNNHDAGMAVLWLFLLPGIIVHEFSHWLMAKLLDLKTGRFRVWPELKGQQIILGSVEIQKTNRFLDSLVGLAPFLGGTAVLLLVGYWAFDARSLGLAWEERSWKQVLELLSDTMQVADSWIWLYLLVAISNAMMPSPTDTVAWRSVLIYLGLVTAALLLLGWWPTLSEQAMGSIAEGLRLMLYGFGFTLIIDVILAFLIWISEVALGALRGSKVVYK